jgi:hypothetical protein
MEEVQFPRLALEALLEYLSHLLAPGEDLL